MFLNFKWIFYEWNSSAVDIFASNNEYEQESVEATEEVYYGDDQTVVPTSDESVGGANND